jgi:hypothetical protein
MNLLPTFTWCGWVPSRSSLARSSIRIAGPNEWAWDSGRALSLRVRRAGFAGAAVAAEPKLHLRNTAAGRFRAERVQQPADEQRRDDDDGKSDDGEAGRSAARRKLKGPVVKPVDRKLECHRGQARNQTIQTGADDRPRLLMEAMEFCGDVRHQ